MKIAELLLVLATVAAYGYAIAKLFQVAIGETTTNPPNINIGLLALAAAAYGTYFAYEADTGMPK